MTSRHLIRILLTFGLLFISPNLSQAAIECYKCHGTPNDYRPPDTLSAPFRNPSTGGFQGNHRTHMAQTTNADDCAKCHPGSADYTASHRDGLIKVSSRINSSLPATWYNNVTSAFPQTATPTLGSCSDVNCHFETATPIWGSATFASPADCSKCHGAAPADGTHPQHAAYYGTPATTNSCLKCHSDHTGDPVPFAHATSAGNRGLMVSFAAAPNNGFGRYTGNVSYPNYLPSQSPLRNGTCKDLYCHSPGTKNVNVDPPNITAAWGGSLTCTGCHKADLASGSYIGTGSHKAHVYGGVSAFAQISCVKCHAATVAANMTIPDASRHVNKQIEVAFINSSSAANGSYNGSAAKPSSPSAKTPGSGYANCQNIYCHSSGQGVGGSWPPVYTMPTWGSADTGKCGTCHGTDGKSSHANYTSVMQRQISSGSHTKHLTYTFGINSHAFICVACHAYNKADAIENAGSGCNIRACHQGGLTTALKHANHEINIDIPDYFGSTATYNGTTKPGHDGNGYNGSSCTSIYCHSNGTSVATGTIPVNTSTVWGSGALACSGCHANPPSYSNDSPKKNSHGIHGAYGCNKCHSRTTTNGTDISSTANHVNKVYDVYSGAGAGFTYTYNASGGSCSSISCHGTTAAQWGSTACLGCHSVEQGNRVAVASQFGGSNSHHIQGAVTDDKCFQCHWEANSDGTINSTYHHSGTPGAPVELVIYGAGSRPASYTVGTTAVQYHYTTSVNRAGVQKITTHCLGCHSDQNNTATPFGDGRTPKQYAWDGTSVAARYSQSGSTTWGKYTSASYPNTVKKKIGKAYSAHGNSASNQRGWNTTSGVDGAISNSSGTVNVQCYDCHNSHGSSVAGITSRYSSATGRQRGAILKDTVAGKGGYAIAYKSYTGGSLTNKNRRNPGASLCLDCHMTPTAGTTPWGYTSTYGASQAILGYWDAPSYLGYTSAGAERRYSFKGLNPMKGGHFGASTGLKSTPAESISGLCTPCHDPHGVSPTLGSKQQYAVPLLKGTWVTSPYKEDTAPANNTRFTNRMELGGEGLQYYIDQNTFGSAISGGAVTGLAFNNVSTAAGLCVACHTKSRLTKDTCTNPVFNNNSTQCKANGATWSSNSWKSKERVHETVQGWKTSDATVKHSYTCSKCHSPHTNSVLPRLMVTNCLDGRHKGRTGYLDAKISDSGRGEYVYLSDPPDCSLVPSLYGGPGDEGRWCGSHSGTWKLRGTGLGRIPGSWRGDKKGLVDHSVSCHEGQTGSGTDQSWNTVTPWAVYPTMTISVPVATVNGQQMTITWTTNIPSSSTVNYGPTSAYGSTATGTSSVLNHSVTFSNFENHATSHYQVNSIASDGQQASSGDNTFYVSFAPTVPVRDLMPMITLTYIGAYCPDTCPETLYWRASTNPGGGPLEYQVQAYTLIGGVQGNLQTSAWVAAPATSLTMNFASLSATLPTRWYWAVQARDANHPDDPTSGWSTAGNFRLSRNVPSSPTYFTADSWSGTSTSIQWYFGGVPFAEGYLLHDVSDNLIATVPVSGTNSEYYVEETGLQPNTEYTRHVHAYNGAGNSVRNIDELDMATMITSAAPPNVAADKTPATVYNTPEVTFTNAAGFGSGGVGYYRVIWDQNPLSTFHEQYGDVWDSGTLTKSATAEGDWYLHVQSYNAWDYVDYSDYMRDYGPFNYVAP